VVVVGSRPAARSEIDFCFRRSVAANHCGPKRPRRLDSEADWTVGQQQFSWPSRGERMAVAAEREKSRVNYADEFVFEPASLRAALEPSIGIDFKLQTESNDDDDKLSRRRRVPAIVL
jgi:hypothetical protein